MSEKNEALRLADALDDPRMVVFFDQRSKAAAELRRRSAEHEEDQRVIAVWRGRTQRAEAQRDALLAALKELMEYAGIIEDRCDAVATNKARAAIAKAEGK